VFVVRVCVWMMDEWMAMMVQGVAAQGRGGGQGMAGKSKGPTRMAGWMVGRVLGWPLFDFRVRVKKI
jgi:hypothetical protein